MPNNLFSAKCANTSKTFKSLNCKKKKFLQEKICLAKILKMFLKFQLFVCVTQTFMRNWIKYSGRKFNINDIFGVKIYYKT